MLVMVSPFFLFNAASYFSHTLCGALLLAAAWLASRDDRTPAWVPLAVGALIGWAVLARYFTGVVCAIPIVLWLLRPGVARVRTLALVALGGLPWVLALMAYNSALSGNPWTLTTTPLTVSLWFADGFVLRGADILSTHLLRHLLWTPPVLIIAYLFYLWRGDRELRRGALDWMPVLMVATLYFYVERGGNQYGPRFHYEVFLFLVVFVAGHLFRPGAPTLTASQRRLFGLTVISVALMPVSFAGHAVIEQQVIRERMDPFTRVAARTAAGAGADRRPRRHRAIDAGARPHTQRHRLQRAACCSASTSARPSTARLPPGCRTARRTSTSGTTRGRSGCFSDWSAREPGVKTASRVTYVWSSPDCAPPGTREHAKTTRNPGSSSCGGDPAHQPAIRRTTTGPTRSRAVHLPAPPAGLCEKGDGPGIPGRRLSFCTPRAIIRCLFRPEHRGPCQRARARPAGAAAD